MQLKPLWSNVMYEVVAAEAKTPHGIILSTTEDDSNPIIGKVLDIGPDVKKVEIGSKILLNRGVSTRFIEGFGEKKVVRFFVDEKHVVAQET